ncbi:MAG TPA: LD-carboxypeptidase [Vicinamibacteria bacterium]|jgi:muramoyltetrapeptide carboxypeptidase
MRSDRRGFLGLAAAATAALAAPARARAGAAAGTVKPARLRPGDLVGLANPADVRASAADREAATRALEGLGLRVAPGVVAGEARPADDAARADEINQFFEDDGVRAIVPLRGGFGCARLLRHLDYDLIRRHPKVLIGFSDVGALLLGVHARTGLVTFHGPMGNSAWEPFTVEQLRRVLFEGEAAALPSRGETRALVEGSARGTLWGGNLTVVSSMVGSPYLGGEGDGVLFLEEVGEPYSEVDRMLTQLELAGVLDRVRGLAFGQCTRCASPSINKALTLDRVLLDRLGKRGIPVWRGAAIGHGGGQLTVPIGLPVEMDAGRGLIQLLEPAVC